MKLTTPPTASQPTKTTCSEPLPLNAPDAARKQIKTRATTGGSITRIIVDMNARACRFVVIAVHIPTLINAKPSTNNITSPPANMSENIFSAELFEANS